MNLTLALWVAGVVINAGVVLYAVGRRNGRVDATLAEYKDTLEDHEDRIREVEARPWQHARAH